jgi:hypothetical protein
MKAIGKKPDASNSGIDYKSGKPVLYDFPGLTDPGEGTDHPFI